MLPAMHPLIEVSSALQPRQHGSSALVGGAGAKNTRVAQHHQVVLVEALHMARQILDPVLRAQVM